MELVKNIFFNTDKLVENTNVKISYTGTLFQNGSEEVFIHYGFGLQWNNVSDVKMKKTELGYQAEIPIINGDTLNFCFKNSNNVWDNNNGANYIFPIEKAVENDLTVTEGTNNYLIESSPRKLRRTYIWSKKLRIAIYKILIAVPRLVSGNYKRKITND